MAIDVTVSGLNTVVDVTMSSQPDPIDVDGGSIVIVEDYDNLSHKPSINSVTLSGNKTSSDIGVADAVHTHTKSDITDFPTLATVATSGSYNDLSDTPTIPTDTSDLTNGAGYITSADIPVTDVQVDGTSVVSGGVASIPKANASDYGALKMTQHTGSPLERYVALEGDATYNVPYLGSPSLLINAWHLPEATQSVRGAMSASDKTKLDSIPDGGTTGQVLSKASGTDYDLEWVTPSGGDVTDVQVDGTSIVDSDGIAVLETVTELRDGLMTAVDKQKLDGVESGAEVNLVDDVQVDGTSVVSGGVAEIDLTGKSDVGHTHTKSAITDFPTDVSSFVNDSGYITSPNVVYCTCSTAAGTAAKVATIVEGTLSSLTAGAQAIVKFTNANGKANPTLKIGDTEAKAIMRYGTTAPGTSAAASWNAGSCVLFTYDGTYWQMANYLNTTYSEISEANITNGSGSTSGLVTGRRAKKAVETFAPVKSVNGSTGAVTLTIPTDTSDLTNGAGFVTASEIYPVGAVFETTNSASNPSTLYGGTWQIIGQLKTDADVELETDDGEPLYGDNNISMERTYRYSRISLPT